VGLKDIIYNLLEILVAISGCAGANFITGKLFSQSIKTANLGENLEGCWLNVIK
jgi:hypothetical protein